jgi:pyrroline-5-carboxylate reductase
VQLGFLGTGHIASALVEGLAATNPGDERVVVSPRGAAHAARLAATFRHVRVARNNQAVVNGSDVVFLCVRPPVARQVLTELRFEARQLLVSLVAVTPLAVVRELAAPAMVVRAVPIPSASRGLSPTGFYPAEPRAAALFNRVGSALPLDTERQLSAIWAATALISPAYALASTVSRWLSDEGVAGALAAQFAVEQFRGVLALVEPGDEPQLDRLAARAATPGGLNEQALTLLREAGACDAVRQTLDAVLQRLLAADA